MVNKNKKQQTKRYSNKRKKESRKDVPRESKKQDTLLLPITFANVDRFSKFFYHQTQQ